MILVVDDEAVVVEVLSDILEAMGYDVVSAPGPQRALEVVEEGAGAVELVIVDLNLRRSDGAHLFHQLKAQQPTLRGVLTTGNPHLVSEGNWRRIGFASCLAKPFHINDLADAVEQALAGSGEPHRVDTGPLPIS